MEEPQRWAGAIGSYQERNRSMGGARFLHALVFDKPKGRVFTSEHVGDWHK